MKKRKKEDLLEVLGNYTVFFLVVAFVVTCCMMLFITVLTRSMELELTERDIAVAAKLTFGNVVLITVLFGTIDRIRRKYMVDRPVRIILEAAEKITRGDFSVRLKPLHGVGVDGFNRIIDAINQIAKELSGTETLRTDFIANVSHELKTPLAVMGNYAAMLRQPGITEAEKQEYTQAISESSRRLARLITNILKLNKLENQQIFPQKEEYDLSEQLVQSLLQFEDVWERKKISIETEVEDRVMIRSDPELLSLVWNNLISNAMKFTPEGGTVTVALKHWEDWVEVSVADTGCGMTADVGQHIFEKFYQGDPSHATQGNGLGLALVKRVVDIMNGEIAVTSVPEQGSTFTVRFRRN